MKHSIALLLIIIFSVWVRKDYLTGPIIDRHAWRQTETYAVTQNFLHNGFSLLSPNTFTVHNDVSRNRLFLAEFPLYEFSLAFLLKILGNYIFVARLYSLCLTVLISIFIYAIGLKLFNRNVGFISAILFNVFPSSIFWGRAISPELLALAFSTASFAIMMSNQKLEIIASILLGLAGAIKPFFLVLLVPYIFGLHHKFVQFKLTRAIQNKRRLLLHFAIIIIPMIGWFIRRNIVPEAIRYPPNIFLHFFGLQNPFIFYKNTNYFEFLFKERILGELLTPFFGILFLISLTVIIREKTFAQKFIILWIGSCFISFYLLPWANYYHDYYQLILLPVVALMIGYLLIYTLRKLKNLCTISKFFLVVVVSLLPYYLGYLPFQQAKISYFSSEVKFFQFESDIIAAQIYVPSETYVVVLSDIDGEETPTLLNHFSRKGWIVNKEKICKVNNPESLLQKFVNLGATHFILPKETYYNTLIDNCDRIELFRKMKQHFSIVYSGDQLTLFKISGK